VDEDVRGAVGYPFDVARGGDLSRIDPAPMWRALLTDLADEVSAATISLRFHAGFAAAVAGLARDLLHTHSAGRIVALSGGSLQNRIVLEQVKRLLEADGATVLIHARVPANDGGLALGQAAVACALGLAGTDSARGD